MDFSQFLVQNPEIPTNIKPLTPRPTNVIKPKQTKETTNEQKTKGKIKEKSKQTKEKQINIQPIDIELKEPQREFKRGEFVIIQGVPNSNLNVYKGYFGEIKEYIPRSESAYIVLEAMNYPKPIKFPFGHFKHRTF